MLEREQPGTGHNLVRLPEPEKGILKTKKDLAPEFKIQSGEVSVRKMPFDQGYEAYAVRVEPEMSESTLSVINQSISASEDIASMAASHKLISMGLPNVQMFVGGAAIFSFEGEHIAKITPTKGLEVIGEYFLGNTEVIGRKLSTPTQGDESYRLSFYRRQVSWRLRKEQLVTIDFEFAGKSAGELEAKMNKLFASGNYTDEDIRKIVNVKLKVENLSDIDGDESGGEGISLKNPKTDDDGSGLKV